MTAQFYDNGIRRTYEVLAAAIAGGGTLLTIRGPKGLRGRVEDVTTRVTTALTVADSVLTIGAAGVNLSTTLPFTGSAIGDREAPTKAELVAGADIEPDVDTVVDSDGGSTAGAGDITISVIWY